MTFVAVLALGVTKQIDSHALPPRIPGCRSGPMQTRCALPAWPLDCMHQMPQSDTSVAGGVALADVQAAIERADAVELLTTPGERYRAGLSLPQTSLKAGGPALPRLAPLRSIPGQDLVDRPASMPLASRKAHLSGQQAVRLLQILCQ